MNTSTNYGFNLPSRDSDDIVDINLISDNFNKLDEILYELQNIKKFDLTTDFAYSPVPIAGGVATTLRNNNDIIAVATSTGIVQISYPVKFEDGSQEVWSSNVVFNKMIDTIYIASWCVNVNSAIVYLSLEVHTNGLLEMRAIVQ